MPDPTPELSKRAQAIIEGLMRTGRGSDQRFLDTYVRLRARAGGFYWVHVDGSELLRGDDLANAEPLQAPFVEAMMRAGAPLGRR
jgi:hypothetical protein